MLFNSFQFLFLFLPLVLGVFFLAARFKKDAALAWLVLASLVFYGWWNVSYVPLLLVSIAINYVTGVLLRKTSGAGARKATLAGGIFLNLCLLGYFKYANFFVDQVNAATGMGLHMEKVILPVAISFFTFQQIAYLVDTYKQQVKDYSLLHYSAFVSFFPSLISGPITRHNEVLPQLEQDTTYKFNTRLAAIGLTLFAIGVFKKTMLADNVSGTANAVFSNDGTLTFFDAWMGALAYTLQLYFDFSGYSDMAIGVALMFGIRLPVNFDSPYKSVSIIEFWRRWHITLSFFLRDYLYFPLGGGRKGHIRKYINLFTTMLLGGLWHGAGWTFIAWGGLHGAYLTVNHAWRKLRAGVLKISSPPGVIETLLYRGLTLLAIVVGWVYFRADTIADANRHVATMFGLHGISLPGELARVAGKFPALADALNLTFTGLTAVPGMYPKDMLIWVAPLLGIVLFLPGSTPVLHWLEKLTPGDRAYPWIARVGPVAVALLLFAAVSSFMSISQFLYSNF